MRGWLLGALWMTMALILGGCGGGGGSAVGSSGAVVPLPTASTAQPTTSPSASPATSPSPSPNASPSPSPSPTAALQSIQVTPATTVIAVTTSAQLTATGVYANGTTQDLSSQVTWTPATPSVASITASGQVTGLAPGVTSVTATLSGITGTSSVRVTSATLVSLTVSPANNTIARATSLQMAATGTFSDSSTQDLTTQVTWSTASPSVAIINSSGLANGLAAGTTAVTATRGPIAGSTNLTVSAATLTSINVTPTTTSLPRFQTQQMTATAVLSDGTTQNVSSQALWTTAPGGIATVSSSGLASGVAAGTTTVSAAIGTVSGSASLTVTTATLQSIAVTPANKVLGIGSSVQYVATGTFSDGSSRPILASWTTSPTGIVSITPLGVATGLAVGTTTINATQRETGGSTGATVVQGQPPVPTPPANDPNNFQIMLDNRTARGTIYLSAVALDPSNNTTWLSGGGPNNTDWSQPVFQTVNAATGATTIPFTQATYAVQLSDPTLPKDATTGKPILKIPFNSQGTSGRVYISFGQPVPLSVVGTGNPPTQPFSIQRPSQDPNGVGGQVHFDFMEFSQQAPNGAARTNWDSFVDTTNVDFFSMGLTAKGRVAAGGAFSAGTIITFGLDLATPDATTNVYNQMINAGCPWGAGLVYATTGGELLRCLAPSHVPSNTTTLDTAIKNAFTQWTNNQLNFQTADQAPGTQNTYSFSGRVNAATNTFVYFATAGTVKTGPFQIAMPTTQQAIQSTGPLQTGTANQQPEENSARKNIEAAINRGIFQNDPGTVVPGSTITAAWADSTSYYPNGVQSNIYSKILHSLFLNIPPAPGQPTLSGGFVYGFSFDDVNQQASAISECASMTLTINDYSTQPSNPGCP